MHVLMEEISLEEIATKSTADLNKQIPTMGKFASSSNEEKTSESSSNEYDYRNDLFYENQKNLDPIKIPFQNKDLISPKTYSQNNRENSLDISFENYAEDQQEQYFAKSQIGVISDSASCSQEKELLDHTLVPNTVPSTPIATSTSVQRAAAVLARRRAVLATPEGRKLVNPLRAFVTTEHEDYTRPEAPIVPTCSRAADTAIAEARRKTMAAMAAACSRGESRDLEEGLTLSRDKSILSEQYSKTVDLCNKEEIIESSDEVYQSDDDLEDKCHSDSNLLKCEERDNEDICSHNNIAHSLNCSPRSQRRRSSIYNWQLDYMNSFTPSMDETTSTGSSDASNRTDARMAAHASDPGPRPVRDILLRTSYSGALMKAAVRISRHDQESLWDAPYDACPPVAQQARKDFLMMLESGQEWNDLSKLTWKYPPPFPIPNMFLCPGGDPASVPLYLSLSDYFVPRAIPPTCLPQEVGTPEGSDGELLYHEPSELVEAPNKEAWGDPLVSTTGISDGALEERPAKVSTRVVRFKKHKDPRKLLAEVLYVGSSECCVSDTLYSEFEYLVHRVIEYLGGLEIVVKERPTYVEWRKLIFAIAVRGSVASTIPVDLLSDDEFPLHFRARVKLHGSKLECELTKNNDLLDIPPIRALSLIRKKPRTRGRPPKKKTKNQWAISCSRIHQIGECDAYLDDGADSGYNLWEYSSNSSKLAKKKSKTKKVSTDNENESADELQDVFHELMIEDPSASTFASSSNNISKIYLTSVKRRVKQLQNFRKQRKIQKELRTYKCRNSYNQIGTFADNDTNINLGLEEFLRWNLPPRARLSDFPSHIVIALESIIKQVSEKSMWWKALNMALSNCTDELEICASAVIRPLLLENYLIKNCAAPNQIKLKSSRINKFLKLLPPGFVLSSAAVAEKLAAKIPMMWWERKETIAARLLSRTPAKRASIVLSKRHVSPMIDRTRYTRLVSRPDVVKLLKPVLIPSNYKPEEMFSTALGMLATCGARHYPIMVDVRATGANPQKIAESRWWVGALRLIFCVVHGPNVLDSITEQIQVNENLRMRSSAVLRAQAAQQSTLVQPPINTSESSALENIAAWEAWVRDLQISGRWGASAALTSGVFSRLEDIGPLNQSSAAQFLQTMSLSQNIEQSKDWSIDQMEAMDLYSIAAQVKSGAAENDLTVTFAENQIKTNPTIFADENTYIERNISKKIVNTSLKNYKYNKINYKKLNEIDYNQSLEKFLNNDKKQNRLQKRENSIVFNCSPRSLETINSVSMSLGKRKRFLINSNNLSKIKTINNETRLTDSSNLSSLSKYLRDSSKSLYFKKNRSKKEKLQKNKTKIYSNKVLKINFNKYQHLDKTFTMNKMRYIEGIGILAGNNENTIFCDGEDIRKKKVSDGTKTKSLNKISKLRLGGEPYESQIMPEERTRRIVPPHFVSTSMNNSIQLDLLALLRCDPGVLQISRTDRGEFLFIPKQVDLTQHVLLMLPQVPVARSWRKDPAPIQLHHDQLINCINAISRDIIISCETAKPGLSALEVWESIDNSLVSLNNEYLNTIKNVTNSENQDNISNEIDITKNQNNQTYEIQNLSNTMKNSIDLDKNDITINLGPWNPPKRRISRPWTVAGYPMQFLKQAPYLGYPIKVIKPKQYDLSCITKKTEFLQSEVEESNKRSKIDEKDSRSNIKDGNRDKLFNWQNNQRINQGTSLNSQHMRLGYSDREQRQAQFRHDVRTLGSVECGTNWDRQRIPSDRRYVGRQMRTSGRKPLIRSEHQRLAGSPISFNKNCTSIYQDINIQKHELLKKNQLYNEISYVNSPSVSISNKLIFAAGIPRQNIQQDIDDRMRPRKRKSDLSDGSKRNRPEGKLIDKWKLRGCDNMNWHDEGQHKTQSTWRKMYDMPRQLNNRTSSPNGERMKTWRNGQVKSKQKSGSRNNKVYKKKGSEKDNKESRKNTVTHLPDLVEIFTSKNINTDSTESRGVTDEVRSRLQPRCFVKRPAAYDVLLLDIENTLLEALPVTVQFLIKFRDEVASLAMQKLDNTGRPNFAIFFRLPGVDSPVLRATEVQDRCTAIGALAYVNLAIKLLSITSGQVWLVKIRPGASIMLDRVKLKYHDIRSVSLAPSEWLSQLIPFLDPTGDVFQLPGPSNEWYKRPSYCNGSVLSFTEYAMKSVSRACPDILPHRDIALSVPVRESEIAVTIMDDQMSSWSSDDRPLLHPIAAYVFFGYWLQTLGTLSAGLFVVRPPALPQGAYHMYALARGAAILQGMRGNTLKIYLKAVLGTVQWTLKCRAGISTTALQLTAQSVKKTGNEQPVV